MLRSYLSVLIIMSGVLFAHAQSSDSAAKPSTETGQTASSRPIRVSQAVTLGLLIHEVKPKYPVAAREKGIKGYVVLGLLIGKDGVVKDLHVMNGPQELVDAASDAVRQWRYRPYYLNGQPQEVQTTVTINFP